MARRTQRPTETMSVSESRKQYSELLNRVYRDGEQILIEKNGIPIGAIVPIAVVRDAEIIRLKRENAIAALKEVQAAFADVPEDELEQELQKAFAEAKDIQLKRRSSAPEIDVP